MRVITEILGSSGQIIPVSIHLTSRSGSRDIKCDKSGRVTFSLSSEDVPAGFYVSPLVPFHWSIAHAPISSEFIQLTCPALPHGPSGWWHEVLNIPSGSRHGEGIRIGVVDTAFQPKGLAGKVQCVGTGSSLDPAAFELTSHGAQVCSVLVGEPSNKESYGGLARGAQIIHHPAGGIDGVPRPGAVAKAILTLAQDHKVDIINLSLGDSKAYSHAIHGAMQDAEMAGALVFAAAGNSGAILYPAKHAECISVGAIGMRWFAPASSIAAANMSGVDMFSTKHQLYTCNFTPTFGVNAVAPGSGVIFDVNGCGSFDLVGSSFACPAAVATLACVLGNDGDYKALARNAKRTAYARAVFESICHPLGIASESGGWGVPRLPISPPAADMVESDL